MEEKTTVNLTGSFNQTHLKEGEFTFLIPFDDETAKFIGQIVAYWGAFEQRMDAIIAHVSTGMKIEIAPEWRLLSFKKRKKLFRDIMRQYTAAMFPALTATFDCIAARAGDLHWRRNVVAHGYYKTLPGDALPDGSRSAKFVATGMVKGKPQSISLDPETLGKLWHDISHLNGRLMATVNQMGGWVDNEAEMIIPDTDLLSDQPQGNFRILAKPNKSEPPPQPSEA